MDDWFDVTPRHGDHEVQVNLWGARYRHRPKGIADAAWIEGRPNDTDQRSPRAVHRTTARRIGRQQHYLGCGFDTRPRGIPRGCESILCPPMSEKGRPLKAPQPQRRGNALRPGPQRRCDGIRTEPRLAPEILQRGI